MGLPTLYEKGPDRPVLCKVQEMTLAEDVIANTHTGVAVIKAGTVFKFSIPFEVK